jgi:hypothetical protein
VNVSRIRPGIQVGDGTELFQEAVDHHFTAFAGTQLIQLCHHQHQRALQFADRTLRIKLTLFFKAALALQELFSVEIREAGTTPIEQQG